MVSFGLVSGSAKTGVEMMPNDKMSAEKSVPKERILRFVLDITLIGYTYLINYSILRCKSQGLIREKLFVIMRA